MDWPEPPRWLAVVASVVIAPLWGLLIFAWLVHELIRGLADEARRALRND